MSARKRTLTLLTLAIVFGVISVYTSWRVVNMAFILLLVVAFGDAVPKPRRMDKRQAQRLAEIGERDGRLKRERPADYPPAPWLDDTRSREQSATAE